MHKQPHRFTFSNVWYKNISCLKLRLQVLWWIFSCCFPNSPTSLEFSTDKSTLFWCTVCIPHMHFLTLKLFFLHLVLSSLFKKKKPNPTKFAYKHFPPSTASSEYFKICAAMKFSITFLFLNLVTFLCFSVKKAGYILLPVKRFLSLRCKTSDVF